LGLHSDRNARDAARLRFWLLGQDPLAGIVLLSVGGFAFYDTADLTFGSLADFGPGLLPRLLATGVVFAGAIILVASIFSPGERVQDFKLRAPIFIAAGLAAFALTIGKFGLVVAAPLVVLVSSLADAQARPRDTLALAALLTAASILIFGYLLSLSIPVFPSRATLDSIATVLR